MKPERKERVDAIADLDWTRDQRTGEKDQANRPYEGVLDTCFNTREQNERIHLDKLEYDRRYEENSLKAEKGRGK